jgi:hypothetical protein
MGYTPIGHGTHCIHVGDLTLDVRFSVYEDEDSEDVEYEISAVWVVLEGDILDGTPEEMVLPVDVSKLQNQQAGKKADRAWDWLYTRLEAEAPEFEPAYYG